MSRQKEKALQHVLGRLPGVRVTWDADMGAWSTFRAGGRAAALAVVEEERALAVLLADLQDHGLDWRVIGRGSNILVRGGGFPGVIIVLGASFGEIALLEEANATEEEVKIRVGAACPAARLVGWCSRRGLAGIEFLIGIPGSVGGAIRMNAGAWGGEIGDHVRRVFCVDTRGRSHELETGMMKFSYRRLEILAPEVGQAVITGGVLGLRREEPRRIIERCRTFLRERRARQPVNMPSAGSFFRNPPGDSAGRLIDAAGLKGLRKGDAMVSDKHANFIVNVGRATPEDIIGLMEEVRDTVLARTGVLLEPEVEIV
ncbi:MAG: UDP-N-acetylmuramate dehydrogenase [Desulfobulbaceae bacterium]